MISQRRRGVGLAKPAPLPVSQEPVYIWDEESFRSICSLHSIEIRPHCSSLPLVDTDADTGVDLQPKEKKFISVDCSRLAFPVRICVLDVDGKTWESLAFGGRSTLPVSIENALIVVLTFGARRIVEVFRIADDFIGRNGSYDLVGKDGMDFEAWVIQNDEESSIHWCLHSYDHSIEEEVDEDRGVFEDTNGINFLRIRPDVPQMKEKKKVLKRQDSALLTPLQQLLLQGSSRAGAGHDASV